ncbi:leucine-rich repeat domain-containing protein [Enterococcus faecium]|uniref:leucine-rich repeat domain-containing protein n=1 Tax=Enterococcus faecium TaxID=1352 RepID=UPI0013EE13E6|nr:leucine-rich repeat domain-containing protein [Enterococcus faecium]
MTNGTSQGLFVIVAVVIFGIFVLISYVMFRNTLKPSLANIFTDTFKQTECTILGEDECIDYTDTGIFTFNSATQTITGFKSGYTHKSDTLIIPQMIDGKQVKSVSSSNGFSDYNFKKLYVAEGVEIIGNFTFSSSELIKIKLPDSLKEIGRGAFENSKITELELPDNITLIRMSAFEKAPINKLKLPKNIKEIQISAFASAKLTEKLSKSDYHNLSTVATFNPIFK